MSDLSSPPSPDRAEDVADVIEPVGVADAGRTDGIGTDTGDAARIGAELAAVDRALARIESGDYGNCTDCGSRLDDAQLAADPTATTCPDHLGLEHAPEPAVDADPAPARPWPAH